MASTIEKYVKVATTDSFSPILHRLFIKTFGTLDNFDSKRYKGSQAFINTYYEMNEYPMTYSEFKYLREQGNNETDEYKLMESNNTTAVTSVNSQVLHIRKLHKNQIYLSTVTSNKRPRLVK